MSQVRHLKSSLKGMEFIYDALVLEGLIVYFLLKGVIKKLTN